MEQTAVEFIESEFSKWAEGSLFIPQHIIDKAKQIEKEQKKNAYTLGRTGGTIKDFNETFKSH